jgi:nucleoside-diphosphate-sugar epimerase
MKCLPERIINEDQLEELISTPYSETVDMFSRLDGDIIFLGVGGKIGPSLALMAKKACLKAGIDKKIFGVSRFSNKQQKLFLENNGIETISGDLLDTDFLKSLPQVKNVFFLAGMKFGSEDNLALTWAMNSYMPALVAENYRNSRIVAYSTGCVYPLVSVESGGSKENDKTEPVGEYAQSCLGRERMFEYGSKKYNTPVAIIRLNYSVELRYGVLVDIATKVKNEMPVDLSMGYFNMIWQGDANNIVLRSIEITESPAKTLNITGEEILSVRDVAVAFGKLLKKEPKFAGKESKTALLNNSQKAFELFGRPKVSLQDSLKWTAEWINSEGKLLGKPTHFEVRDGKY